MTYFVDSGGVTASMSKNQKKRARKKLKKAEEADEASGGGGDMGEKGERGGDEEAGSERREEEKVVVVRDPVAELKEKLSEAKSSQVYVNNATYTCIIHMQSQPCM